MQGPDGVGYQLEIICNSNLPLYTLDLVLLFDFIYVLVLVIKMPRQRSKELPFVVEHNRIKCTHKAITLSYTTIVSSSHNVLI